ncbi:MAG: type II toxin-antitoxin system VapC family toxin [Bacteroidota bacterium]
MTWLLDTNIVLRVFNPHDPAHADIRGAVETLLDQGARLHISVQNAAEVWNASTRSTDRNGLGYTPHEAAALLDLIETIAPVLPDHPDTYSQWKRLVREFSVSGVQVHDARLAAWMLAHGMDRILTRNTADFARYESAGIQAVSPRGVLA